MEGGDRGSADAQALPPLRERRRHGQERAVRRRARADPPRDGGRTRRQGDLVRRRSGRVSPLDATDRWQDVCGVDELVDGTGVCALVGGRQIALFLVADKVYALDNFDPGSRANVLSRGLTGDLQNEHVVASPIYKHHFSLATGRCLEDPTFSVAAYTTRIVEGSVQLEIPRVARRIRLVVAGNGMAGMRTVEELLKLGVADRFQIT